MSARIIGRVKTPSGKSYELKRDSVSKEAYVAVDGWTLIGRANSASEALIKAEAFVYKM